MDKILILCNYFPGIEEALKPGSPLTACRFETGEENYVEKVREAADVLNQHVEDLAAGFKLSLG